MQWSLAEHCQIMDFILPCHAFSMHQVWSSQKYSEMAISIMFLKHSAWKTISSASFSSETVYCFDKTAVFFGMGGVCHQALLYQNEPNSQLAEVSRFSDFTETKVNSKCYVKLLLIRCDLLIIEYHTLLIQQTFLFLSDTVVHNI